MMGWLVSGWGPVFHVMVHDSLFIVSKTQENMGVLGEGPVTRKQAPLHK